MAKKRGQVSVFFIIALMVIMLGALYFYYQRIAVEGAEIMQPEIAPIQNFVEGCIDQTAMKGLARLGFNGGYIGFPSSVSSDPRSYLASGVAEIKNPYWWYDGVNAVPTEEFIILQLEEYFDAELGRCINNFEAFSTQFAVEEVGDINSEVVLTENNVVVNVNYPINVLRMENRTRTRLDRFSKTIPIRLKKAYQLAKRIMEAENRDNFFELKTIDLISMDRNIPTTDVEATCEPRVWNFNDVQNKLKQLLRVNLPYIRIAGSNYASNIFVSNPFGASTYKDSYFQYHYLWDVSDEKFPEFSAAFTFDEGWPFAMQARPRDGNLLKSNTQKGFDLLEFFCLHIWHFTYDVSYPVKATITDTNPAYRPYTFNFAFKVSVDHNQPNRQNFGTTIFETEDRPESEEFCRNARDEVTIFTMSNTTEEQADITDVQLTLTCGPFKCDLGKTEWLSFGAAAGLTKEVPYCVNAILRGKKDGVMDAQMFIQTDRQRSYTMYMKPVKKFTNYRIVKHQLANPSIESSLTESEKASIQIKLVNGTFETFGVYPIEDAFPINLLLEEANYDVAIYLTDNDNILGGYRQKWSVSPEELRDANEIVFHILEQGIVSDDERALFISGLESYSGQIPQPELI